MKQHLLGNTILMLAVVLLLPSGCRKQMDPASWDVDLSTPLVKGTLNLSDLDEVDEVHADNEGLLHVLYSDTVFRIGLDTLIGIPDTTLFNEFVIPVGGFPWPPGVPFYNDTTITTFDLKDVELTLAKVRESLFSVKLTNTLKKQILVRYRILSASNAGDTFLLEEYVPAKSVFEGNFDLDGFDLDLRGPEGKHVNTIYAYVEAMIDPAETVNYIFSAGDRFEIENTFKKIIPQYALGFFGQQTSHHADATDINVLKSVAFANADILEFDVEMTIDNGIGADLGLTLNALESYNTSGSAQVALNHEIVGASQQIGRALNMHQPQNPVKHIVKKYVFNESNSNLDALFEINPAGISYDLDLEINPLGNISLGNDFVYYGHDLSASLNLDIPLKVGFEGLTLRDTFDMEFSAMESVNEDAVVSGVLRGFINNGFPFGASLQLYFIDDAGVVIDSVAGTAQVIKPAITDASGEVSQLVESVVEFPFTRAKIVHIKGAVKVLVVVVLDSYNKQVVSIRDQQTLDFKFVMDLKTTVE